MPPGQGNLSSPPYNHNTIARGGHSSVPSNNQSPATGAEGLPAPFEHQQSYPPHSQAHPQHLPLPSTTAQPSTGQYAAMRSPAPYLNLSGVGNSRPYSLPSVHDQGQGAQGQRHYEQMASPQPYSPGAHHSAQYNMNTQLRPGGWQHHAPGMQGQIMSPPQPSMIPGQQPPMMAGHPSSMGHPHQMMYAGGHPFNPYFAQPAPAQERPFKCEQCRAAFSRNHDLKRHKRIHLAVKPFPCDFCDKTFTRKDALKRHRLVKNCEAKYRKDQNQANTTDGEQRTPPQTP